MGNKESSDSIITLNDGDDQRHVPTPPRPKAPKNTIPKEVLQIFEKAFNKLRLETINFKDIVPYIKEITHPPGAIILEQGSPASGIFVIKNGICNIVACDKKTIICQLEKYDFFGEVSTIYNVPCTCSVMVDKSESCDVLFLDVTKFKIAQDDAPTMEAWFVQQKYLDLTGLFPPRKNLQIIVQKSLLCSYLFHNWSEDAIVEMMKYFPQGMVEVYQPGTFLCYEGDDDISAYLLINGSVELLKNNENVISLNTKHGSILFSEENLLFNEDKNVYSIKAFKTCQVVPIHEEYFTPILARFPVECAKLMALKKVWNFFLEEQLHDIDIKNTYLVNPNIISFILKETIVFSNATLSFLHAVALKTEYISYDENTVIAENVDTEDPFLVFLVSGSAAVVTPSSNIIAKLEKGEMFYLDSKFPEHSRLVSRSATVVGKIYKSLIKKLRLDYESDADL